MGTQMQTITEPDGTSTTVIQSPGVLIKIVTPVTGMPSVTVTYVPPVTI